MTYSEKLKDPRWLSFRRDFIASRRRHCDQCEDWCDECGEDTEGPLHVHHRRYRDGAEPWEYEYAELRLLCEECHERIHAVEEQARNLIRQIPAHVCYEFRQLLEELEACYTFGAMPLKQALAHCKNQARSVYYGEKYSKEEGINVTVQTFDELEKKYIKMLAER